MKKVIAGAVLAVTALSGASFLSARTASKAAAPSTSQIVLSQWNEIGRKLVAMAEDFPEDKYDFKPTAAQRTFAEQMLHVAASMYYFTDPAQGQKPRYPDDPKRDGLKTKAEIVAFTKKCVEDGAALIKSKGDKGMSEWTTDPESKQQVQISDLAYITASLLCITAWPGWCPRSLGPRNRPAAGTRNQRDKDEVRKRREA